MTINLTGVQRFKIQDMVTAHTSTQRMVFADSLKWRALTKPIQFTDDEQRMLTFHNAPNGTIVSGLDNVPVREFDLSVTSLHLLKTLMETFPGITDKDVDWMEPIMEQMSDRH